MPTVIFKSQRPSLGFVYGFNGATAKKGRFENYYLATEDQEMIDYIRAELKDSVTEVTEEEKAEATTLPAFKLVPRTHKAGVAITDVTKE